MRDVFYIDVDEATQENAVFINEEFVCFEDDSEKLVEMLNAYLIKDNHIIQENRRLEEEIEQLRDGLKKALPVLLAIDFKVSVNECEALNRLCEFVDDDFIAGKDCDEDG